MSTAKRLYRNSSAGRVAGVCAGLADYLEADVTVIRLIWVILSIVPGGFIGGFVAYLVAWAIMPDATPAAPAEPSRKYLTRSRVDRKIAGVCGGIAEHFGTDSTVVRLVWAVLTIFPGAILLGVAIYLVAWFIIPPAPSAPAVVSPSVA